MADQQAISKNNNNLKPPKANFPYWVDFSRFPLSRREMNKGGWGHNFCLYYSYHNKNNPGKDTISNIGCELHFRNTPVSRSINSAVHFVRSLLCTGLASFVSQLFTEAIKSPWDLTPSVLFNLYILHIVVDFYK